MRLVCEDNIRLLRHITVAVGNCIALRDRFKPWVNNLIAKRMIL